MIYKSARTVVDSGPLLLLCTVVIYQCTDTRVA